MAINPMQRKTRISFMAGFLLAIIIGAVAVWLMYKQKNEIEAENLALKALQSNAYVAAIDLKSGDEVSLEPLEDETVTLSQETVQTTLSRDELIDEETFKYIDEDGEEIQKLEKAAHDDEYVEKKKKMIVKTDVPKGTIITKDMLEEIDDTVTADQRLQEYNMLILPTMLEEGNYIDIRLELPSSENYIVLSKKKVLKATADTIWLKMREDEILTLGNAIVEAYTITGSKLYATLYTEPGRQEEASPTYPISNKIVNLINSDSNIVDKAKKGLQDRINNGLRQNIEDVLGEYAETAGSAVESGFQEEVSKMQASRQQYVESLGADTTTTATTSE